MAGESGEGGINFIDPFWGSSNEMLSLRFTSLLSFFVSSLLQAWARNA